MRNGSKTVKIKGQEVMLKDLSFYQTSPLGNEAATRNLGAGVVTHVITGKTYFVAWSMDVMIEGQNVDRHTDFTTSNHASPMANASVPMANTAFAAPSGDIQNTKCPCCGKRHAGQQGGVPVSEDEWYGLSEGPEIDREIRHLQNHPPHPANTKAVREWQKALSGLVDRSNRFEQRKEAVRAARAGNCKSLPEPPCDVYYVFPQKPGDTAKNESTAVRKKKEIEREWDNHRPKYMSRRPHLVSDEQINHRTPKAAGGCPAGIGNLVPHSRLTPECQAADKALTRAQSDAAARWQVSLQT